VAGYILAGLFAGIVVVAIFYRCLTSKLLPPKFDIYSDAWLRDVVPGAAPAGEVGMYGDAWARQIVFTPSVTQSPAKPPSQGANSPSKIYQEWSRAGLTEMEVVVAATPSPAAKKSPARWRR
jgi:hypothetical protein